MKERGGEGKLGTPDGREDEGRTVSFLLSLPDLARKDSAKVGRREKNV